MKSSGPDSLTSWVIAAACCFINMMTFGMSRLAGILFVASISRFQTSRQKASFPYTFCSCVKNSLSPLVGYLGHKFGVRTVTSFGCLVGAIGAGMCYFAENIYTVTILWGAVFGVGFGMGNTLLPVSINQYFDKHRATASGISFSGACFGSFILPPIVEILLDTYGLSGTYLFLSGFILNCVPAALLLTKPRFEIKISKCSNVANNERQSVASGRNVKMYTAENGSQKSLSISKGKESANFAPKSESCQDPKVGEMKSNLTYEERIKRLSTQTLLSEYSIHMSTSEPLDVDEIIENSKGRRQVDPAVLEAEALSLSSHNTDQDVSSEKDDVFEKESRSSSVQCEKSISAETSNVNYTLSSESLVSEKNKSFSKGLKEGYSNYGYQVEIEDMKSNFPPNLTHQKNMQRHQDMQSSDNEVYLNYTYQNNKATDQYKKPRHNPNTFPKSSEWSDVDNFKIRHGVLSPASDKEIVVAKTKTSSFLGSFSVIFDPAFLMITITLAIYTLNFLTVITIIVDFARDLNIETSNEKYILMALSVGDIIGRLGLGWITDYGYMSTSSFAALCFACQGITTSAIVLSDGFIPFIILCTLYGLSEAGNIVIAPILIAQYIDEDKQTVAISSSNFLSGPLCLAVAPLIGYFRDYIGSYHYIFYEIGILSALCCVGLLLLPCLARCRR